MVVAAVATISTDVRAPADLPNRVFSAEDVPLNKWCAAPKTMSVLHIAIKTKRYVVLARALSGQLRGWSKEISCLDSCTASILVPRDGEVMKLTPLE